MRQGTRKMGTALVDPNKALLMSIFLSVSFGVDLPRFEVCKWHCKANKAWEDFVSLYFIPVKLKSADREKIGYALEKGPDTILFSSDLLARLTLGWKFEVFTKVHIS